MVQELNPIGEEHSAVSSISRMKVLSGSALKVIACLSMLTDHLAQFYLYKFAWTETVLFTALGKVITPYQLMLMFGRFAFPLFVFLLVIGFERTHNKTKYGLNLLLLAILSEIPFNLMSGQSLLFPKQNVVFTLFMGFVAMCCLERFKTKPIIGLVSVVLLYLVSRLSHAVYQSAGFIFILLMYGLRKEGIIRCVVAPVLLQMKAMVFLSLLLTTLYNGKRGFIKTPLLKYCFYAFYPVHMLVVYGLSLL